MKSLQLFLISDHQTSRREPIGNQALSPTFILNSGNIFIFLYFQTLELISQSLQLSQNGAKDPRGTLEHGTSILCQWFWNFNLSSRIVEVVLHINPTCGVEAELGIQIPTETVLNGTYCKKELHNAPPYIPKGSANIAKATIPVTDGFGNYTTPPHPKSSGVASTVCPSLVNVIIPTPPWIVVADSVENSFRIGRR